MSRPIVAVRANGSCTSKGYSWFRCAAPYYFTGCCKNGTSPCDNGCEDDELDPLEKVASSASNTQASTKAATTLSTATIQQSMMSTRATSSQTASLTPVGGTIVPDTLPPSTTSTGGSSTNKGGAIFQVPTTTTTSSVPAPTSPSASSTPTSTGKSPAAQPANQNLGPIIGGIVGGILLFILALLAFLHWRRRKTKKELELHTVPYSVAVPFSVNRTRRPETLSSSTSATPGLTHEKRATAETVVERNDSKRIVDEQQEPIELPTHNSRTFSPVPETTAVPVPAHPQAPSELPAPTALQSTLSELPTHDLRPRQSEIPRNMTVSPVDIDPSAPTRTSTVSPLIATAPSPVPSSNSPHIMAWASFDDPTPTPTSTPQAQSGMYPGKRAYSPRGLAAGGGGGMQERVTGPNMEPVWPAHRRQLSKVKEGPGDVGIVKTLS